MYVRARKHDCGKLGKLHISSCPPLMATNFSDTPWCVLAGQLSGAAVDDGYTDKINAGDLVRGMVSHLSTPFKA